MHNKQQVKKGFIWSALDSFATQAIGLVISLTLASMLGPSIYGLVAMLAIFIGIARVFVESGFSEALIRKVNRSDVDLATSFYFSFFISLIFYSFLYFCSPYIADFYEQPELIVLTRVIALTIIINNFATIPRVLLSINLNFKAQAKCNFIALATSGTLALSLAYLGYGVWALIGQQIAHAITNVITMNIAKPWVPKQAFCYISFKELFGFGSRLLLARLLENFYTNLYGLIIGKQYSAAQLGLFNQANTLSSVPATTITGIIQKVTYPMLSTMQQDTKKLDAAYLMTLQYAAFVIFPVMFGLCIIAKPLIAVLLGPQWQGSAEFISIITMALVLYPIHAINLNMLQVKGRSDLFLKLEIIKKIIMTLMLIITVPMGIKAMCVGMVVQSYLALLVNTHYTGKLSSLTAYKQLTALLPIGVITALSAFVGYIVGININSNILQIVTMLIVALSTYIVIMLLVQRPLLVNLKHTLKA